MRTTATESPLRARKRQRLDLLLVERELAESRQKAQALILAGQVLVDGVRAEKAGSLVASASQIEVLMKSRYVGRGGLKLEAALDKLQWDLTGLVALDVGSSTGGFIDCMLQGGAARVISVDVGPSQLDWKLRSDGRVRVIDHANARYLAWDTIGEPVDLITMDVSFISATAILPALTPFAKRRAAGSTPGSTTRLLLLVKPQFEVGKGKVGKGGIVRDPELRRGAVERVRACAIDCGWAELRDFPCAVPGAEGNQEYFLAGEFQGA
jgi:23S rRNA (cytidine1920-2'-O)/16S rRNA (cytidine1409-2'-O)-methyltransferase